MEWDNCLKISIDLMTNLGLLILFLTLKAIFRKQFKIK